MKKGPIIKILLVVIPVAITIAILMPPTAKSCGTSCFSCHGVNVKVKQSQSVNVNMEEKQQFPNPGNIAVPNVPSLYADPGETFPEASIMEILSLGPFYWTLEDLKGYDVKGRVKVIKMPRMKLESSEGCRVLLDPQTVHKMPCFVLGNCSMAESTYLGLEDFELIGHIDVPAKSTKTISKKVFHEIMVAAIEMGADAVYIPTSGEGGDLYLKFFAWVLGANISPAAVSPSGNFGATATTGGSVSGGTESYKKKTWIRCVALKVNAWRDDESVRQLILSMTPQEPAPPEPVVVEQPAPKAQPPQRRKMSVDEVIEFLNRRK